MKALHEMTLNEQTLMPKDWLRRRLTRLVYKGQKSSFRTTVTLGDVSNWFGVTSDLMRHIEDGKIQISDEWQVKLSQFFYLLDMGLIEIKLQGRHKIWARATPTEPPCKEPRPRVDFSATKIKFD